MTRVVWLCGVLGDLAGIHAYIARDNPFAAKRVVGAVREAVAMLKEHPGCGRPGRIDGTRELVVGRYPYIVAYRVTAAVEILAVVHTSRRWLETMP